jgi:hypothetical protein
LLFEWAGITPPNYPELWQCIGMIVGVYGIGYLIAARDPVRHWPIVLVGLLGKIFGPIGFAWAWWRGTLPLAAGWVNVTNDLIWWWPFAAILAHAVRMQMAPDSGDEPVRDFASEAGRLRSQHGRTLAELSQNQPVLVTFLRHIGCTFCRETLAELARLRPQLEAQRLKLAVVHMGRDQEAQELLARFGLGEIDRLSDPGSRLYRAAGLARGTLWQVIGPRVWWRGFQTTIWQRHGAGRVVGDAFQLGGVLVVENGQIIAAQRHKSSAGRPEYGTLASQACRVS